jgi:hypothetical protein
VRIHLSSLIAAVGIALASFPALASDLSITAADELSEPALGLVEPSLIEEFPGYPATESGWEIDSAILAPGAFRLGELSQSPESVSEQPVPRFKKQALQRVSASGGWLGATQGGDLSQSFSEARVTLGIPLGSLENILAVTPSARVDWINAAPELELPTELFDFGVEFFHLRPLNSRWKLLAMVRPSLRSDLVIDDAPIRVFGLGLLMWDAVPDRVSIALGAVYLGRPDIPVLPAVGLTWTPDPSRRLELQFPRSRLLRRFAKDGASSELWGHVSIGIGGNTWVIASRSGSPEEIALRDLRLTTGIEKVVAGGGGWFLETGLALDRRLENLTSNSNFSLSNGIFFSAGWAY